jgi:hydrogenase/urease accessory protein HupE
MKRLLSVFVLLSLAPLSAHAHLVQTGFGTFYDGINHFLITPEDLLVVVGLGLFAGLNGRKPSRSVLIGLPAAWLIGGLVGMHAATDSTLPWITTLSFGIIGGLVAADARIPDFAIIAITGAMGLLHGFVNGATMAPGGADWLAVAGVTTATLMFASVLGAIVVSLKADWQRIVVRVAGSWMVAICLLMFGWLWKLES